MNLPAVIPLGFPAELFRFSFELISVNSLRLLTLSKFGVSGGFKVDASPEVVMDRNIMSISSSNDGPKSNTLSLCIISSSEIS